MRRSAFTLAFTFVLGACGGGTEGPATDLNGDDTSIGSESGENESGADTGDPGFDVGGGDDTGGGGDATVDDSMSSGDGGGDALVFDAPGDTTCATSEVTAAKPPVDVIVVVDQSGSMNDDIVRVKANINKLSDYLMATGLDYRVVMVARVGTSTASTSTDICVPPPLGGPAVDCGATTKPLRNSNPPIFRTSNQSIGSTNALSMLVSTYDSPTVGIGWKDAIRPDAFKAFVPITDDNSSMTEVNFDTQILAKGAGVFGTAAARKYGAFPIMGSSTYPSEVRCGTTMVNNGPTYVKLVKLVGGKWFPLCSTDFGPLFTDMAKSIAAAVACEVTVPPPPAGEVFDPAKINVIYSPSSGGSVPVPRDDSAPCATGANGWQLSADKSKILLCGTACAGLKADPGGKVSVQFGCAGKGPPPPPDAGMCTPFGAKCGDADICCPPLVCLPGPDGANICRAKGPA